MLLAKLTLKRISDNLLYNIVVAYEKGIHLYGRVYIRKRDCATTFLLLGERKEIELLIAYESDKFHVY